MKAICIELWHVPELTNFSVLMNLDRKLQNERKNVTAKNIKQTRNFFVPKVNFLNVLNMDTGCNGRTGLKLVFDEMECPILIMMTMAVRQCIGPTAFFF